MAGENQAVKEILSQNPFQKIRQGASNPPRIVVTGSKGAGHFSVRMVKRQASAGSAERGRLAAR